MREALRQTLVEEAPMQVPEARVSEGGVVLVVEYRVSYEKWARCCLLALAGVLRALSTEGVALWARMKGVA